MKISVINNNLYTNFRAKEQPEKKQKITMKQIEEEYPVIKLSEVKFKNGVAKNKGKNYTGRVQGSLSDGREYTLYYVNGYLKVSEMGEVRKEYARDNKNKLTSIYTKTGKNTGNSVMSYYMPEKYIRSSQKQLSNGLHMSQTKTVYTKDKDGKQKTTTFIYENDLDDTDALIIDTIENKKAKQIKSERRVGEEKDIQRYYMEKDKNGNIISVIKKNLFNTDYFEISRDKKGRIQHVEKTENAPIIVLNDFRMNHPVIYKG